MYANRGEIRASVESLGLSHLGTARLNDYIDEAADELHKELLWAWRLMSTPGGSPPISVAQLGPIEAVLDVSGVEPRPLDELDPSQFRAAQLNPATAGPPRSWSRDFAGEGDDNDLIRVWPVGGSVVVQHFSARVWLNGGVLAADDNDVPTAPPGLRDMIRQLAGEKGLGDDGRSDEGVAQRQAYERRLERETEHNDRTGVHEGLRSVAIVESY